jgi:hypothetical protein
MYCNRGDPVNQKSRCKNPVAIADRVVLVLPSGPRQWSELYISNDALSAGLHDGLPVEAWGRFRDAVENLVVERVPYAVVC